VHYRSYAVEGASSYLVIRADVTRNRGAERVTDYTYGTKPASIEIVVVADTAYVRGGRPGLERLVFVKSAKAARYAGKWISIPLADKLYASVVPAATLPSLLRQIEPRGRLKAVLTRIKGARAVQVRGTSQNGEVDLAARAPGQLPIKGSYVAAGGLGYTTLSHWNEIVKLQAPRHAVPIATLRR
jgi:hypothetical protein